METFNEHEENMMVRDPQETIAALELRLKELEEILVKQRNTVDTYRMLLSNIADGLQVDVRNIALFIRKGD